MARARAADGLRAWRATAPTGRSPGRARCISRNSCDHPFSGAPVPGEARPRRSDRRAFVEAPASLRWCGGGPQQGAEPRSARLALIRNEATGGDHGRQADEPRDPRSDAEKARADLMRNDAMGMAVPGEPARTAALRDAADLRSERQGGREAFRNRRGRRGRRRAARSADRAGDGDFTRRSRAGIGAAGTAAPLSARAETGTRMFCPGPRNRSNTVQTRCIDRPC